ncbi:MAG TPA: hypothetical protein VK815_03465 [Candidatus Acidoferrales bacterium]|jgi:hypothetical protein|nr:hypothetical protein [Candidatus Acidoferrales bacterium]
MKTPREILLAQHRAAEARLDVIRQTTLAAVTRMQPPEPAVHATLFQTLWQELFFSTRRTWTGLAMVWALIFLVNFSQRDNVNSVTGKPVHSGGPVMSLQAQQRWMNELFADRALPPEVDRPRNSAPKPRTQAAQTAAV